MCFFFSLLLVAGSLYSDLGTYLLIIAEEDFLFFFVFCFFLPCTYIVAHVICFVNSQNKQNILLFFININT